MLEDGSVLTAVLQLRSLKMNDIDITLLTLIIAELIMIISWIMGEMSKQNIKINRMKGGKENG